MAAQRSANPDKPKTDDSSQKDVTISALDAVKEQYVRELDRDIVNKLSTQDRDMLARLCLQFINAIMSSGDDSAIAGYAICSMFAETFLGKQVWLDYKNNKHWWDHD